MNRLSMLTARKQLDCRVKPDMKKRIADCFATPAMTEGKHRNVSVNIRQSVIEYGHDE